MIRWFMQVMVMAGDIAIAAACVIVLLYAPLWASIPMIYLTYRAWKSTDGAIAWTKKGRQSFLCNAKELGI